MKTWDRVTISWRFSVMGIGTSVCMDDAFNLKAYDPYLWSPSAAEKIHGLFSMECVSQPDDGDSMRKGEMTLDIRRMQGPNSPPRSAIIVQLLRAQMKLLTVGHVPTLRYAPRVVPPERESWDDTKFKIYYLLDNGEQFCHKSIKIARAVFKALGVHDDDGYWLAYFTVKRESFVRVDSSWVTFQRWLRMENRLPIYGPEDQPVY